jgi:SSS family solute:Na+ symporter
MISFSLLDIVVILSFFFILISIGLLSSKKVRSSTDYLLAGRNVGLFLFVLINVSTWYGGILGVGEFTYRYGLLSWFTQGLPYYIFAFLFAIFFAEKVRSASLVTIPDKIRLVYGNTNANLSALVVFILVSPAPYLLMTSILIDQIFQIGYFYSLLLSLMLAGIYLVKGGFRANVYTDAFQFFVMFIGFIIILIATYINLGGIDYLKQNLPAEHLKLSGNASTGFIIVWFLIALWTFADPGFHQRSFSAKDGKVAKWGIIISIFFWMLFDFLTTSTGLYARASIPDLAQPLMAYPLLSEKILGDGLKGIFYIGMLATIISTLNSFLFLSATTLGKDFIYEMKKKSDEKSLQNYVSVSVMVSGFISILICLMIPSVVQIWYTLGSILIPGIILAVISSYYEKIKVSEKYMTIEIISGVSFSTIWLMIKDKFTGTILIDIEPMLVGLLVVLIIHIYGLTRVSIHSQA